MGRRVRRDRCVRFATVTSESGRLKIASYLVDQPKGEDYVDENGIRTTVEYTVNDDGKKVKVRSVIPSYRSMS